MNSEWFPLQYLVTSMSAYLCGSSVLQLACCLALFMGGGGVGGKPRNVDAGHWARAWKFEAFSKVSTIAKSRQLTR